MVTGRGFEGANTANAPEAVYLMIINLLFRFFFFFSLSM